MIIDFHTHIFPDKIAAKTIALLAKNADTEPYSDGSVAGLIGQMEKAGADISVALPVLTNPESFDSVNRFASSVSEAYGTGAHRIISFGAIHPDCDGIEDKMETLKSNGFKGIKLHPEYQSTFIDDEKHVRIMRAAARLDMTVVVHSGVDGAYRNSEVRCTPERVLRLLDKAPHSKLVLAHLGANELFDEVYDKLCGEDVYFDTAYILRHIEKSTFTRILEKHSADKILFATDSPWSDMAEDIKIIKSYGLGEAAEKKIFSGNAKVLLGIN